jgi:hypothetical protein
LLFSQIIIALLIQSINQVSSNWYDVKERNLILICELKLWNELDLDIGFLWNWLTSLSIKSDNLQDENKFLTWYKTYLSWINNNFRISWILYCKYVVISNLNFNQ